MLSKIIKIKNVGLLRDIGQTELKRFTLLYGDNGHGKSTLAWILRACALNDVARIKARKSFGAEDEPDLHLLFTGTTTTQSQFTVNAWVNPYSRIEIFDMDFVDSNVYAGLGVDSQHRQSLFNFILGESLVQLKKQIDDCTAASSTASRESSNAFNSLAPYAKPYPVATFLALTAHQDLEDRIDKATRRVQSLKNVAGIMVKDSPESTNPSFELETTLELFNRTISDLEVEAEKRVRDHIGNRPPRMEAWLEEGLNYIPGAEVCPFCQQGLEHAHDVIKVYGAFFTETYKAFKADLITHGTTLARKLAAATADRLDNLLKVNNARIGSWNEQLPLPTPALDVARLRELLAAAEGIVMPAVSAKIDNPMSVIDPEVASKAKPYLDEVGQILCNYKAEIDQIKAQITAFKSGLQQGSLGGAERDLAQLHAMRNLSDVDYLAKKADYVAKKAAHQALKDQKAALMTQLQQLIPEKLGPYATQINTVLGELGAGFQIVQLAATQPGGRSTVEYKLSFEGGYEVPVGNRESCRQTHAFGSTLSEGDKKTLAFAFFIARLREDQNLGEKVVVIDDPISSLDRFRQRSTAKILKGLSEQVKQLIVASHDARFLAYLRKQLDGAGINPQDVCEMQVVRVQNGATFSPCDLHHEARQGHERKRVDLENFVLGVGGINHLDALEDIRKVLEAYLKKKYPLNINERWTLSQIVSEIDNLNPVVTFNLISHKAALAQLNNDIVEHCHGGNIDEDMGITDVEVRNLAKRAFDLMYNGL